MSPCLICSIARIQEDHRPDGVDPDHCVSCGWPCPCPSLIVALEVEALSANLAVADEWGDRIIAKFPDANLSLDVLRELQGAKW